MSIEILQRVYKPGGVQYLFKKRGVFQKAIRVGSPSGRRYHVVTLQPVGMLITDIWDSEEALNKFSETLIPILKKNGVTPARPTLLQVHNIIS